MGVKRVRFNDELNVTIAEEQSKFDGAVWRDSRNGGVWLRYALLRKLRGEKEEDDEEVEGEEKSRES
jgi:hypothetical protein